MKNLNIFIVMLCIAWNTFTQEYQLNTKSSLISWTGKAAFSAYALTGTLKAKKGIIVIENDSIKKLEVEIDMKSLHHDNKDLKNHLKNKDFFEVKKFEKATFILTNATKIINKKAFLEGNMMIKNKLHKEIIAIQLINDKTISLSFETELDRTKYGVKFNSPSFFKKMKENAIADNFVLKSTLIFN